MITVDHTVYIAGQVSVAPDGSIVGTGDPEAQVRQVWHNLEAAVQAAGGTLADIVKTTTYITNPDYAAAVRTVRNELFQTIKPPTSTDEVKRSLTVFIFSGVLERFPGLKLVSAENNVGWRPMWCSPGTGRTRHRVIWTQAPSR